jgi:integrase
VTSADRPAADALSARREAQNDDRAPWLLLDRHGLVFTTRTGRPIESRNLVCSFKRVCADNQIRSVRVRTLRHTAASLLKDLRVPARDAPAILGHTRISTTLEIYINVDKQARRDALTRLHGLLDERQD